MADYKYHARQSIDTPAWHTVYAFFLDPSKTTSENVICFHEFVLFLFQQFFKTEDIFTVESSFEKDLTTIKWFHARTIKSDFDVTPGKWLVVMHNNPSQVQNLSNEEFNEIYVKG